MRGQGGCADDLVGQTKGKVGQCVGRGGSDDEGICRLGQGDMAGKALMPPFQDIVVHLILSQGGKGSWSNERCGRTGH